MAARDRFSGGTGGSFEPFNNNFAAPVSKSAQNTCLLGYFYNTSNDLLEVNDTFGESIFSTNIDNNPTTMSLNLRGESGINNFDFLQVLATSSLNQDNFLYYSALSGQDRMKYKIDEIQFGGGYGGFESDYGETTYGTNYSSSVFFELLVIENSGFTPTDGEEVQICFEINGEPYSGLTESEVSASEFYAQYPGFVQQWSETIVPSLGIPFPYNQDQTPTNGTPPVNNPRVDQREFYDGEFGNDIQVGPNEICKTFFGQDSIIDYFFRIHNPTTVDQQGNDRGSSYRSAIFYQDAEEKAIAEAMIKVVNESGRWNAAVVTTLEAFSPFWPAEPEHQDYLVRNPNGYTCHFERFDQSFLAS